MSPQILNTGLLIISLLLYLYACKVLIDDARGGYSLTMGGEGYFSQLWIFASVLGVSGAVRLWHFSWWLFVPVVIVLYVLSFPVRRGIKAVFLGMDTSTPGAGDNTSGTTDNEK